MGIPSHHVQSAGGGSGAGPSQLGKYGAISLRKMQRFFDGPYFGKRCLRVYLVTMYSQLGGGRGVLG